MMTRSTNTSPIVLLLILGLLHAGRRVESFSSTLAHPKSAPTALVGSQQSIIRPEVVPLHRNIEAVTAATSSQLNYHSFRSSSALRVATGVAEDNTADVSSSGSEDYNENDKGGLPEFGADGLYHITNEDEYK
jgi:hypothetical protein